MFPLRNVSWGIVRLGSLEKTSASLQEADTRICDLDRVGIVWNPVHPNTPITFREAEEGLRLWRYNVHGRRSSRT
jgi:hypothetical protein